MRENQTGETVFKEPNQGFHGSTLALPPPPSCLPHADLKGVLTLKGTSVDDLVIFDVAFTVSHGLIVGMATTAPNTMTFTGDASDNNPVTFVGGTQ